MLVSDKNIVNTVTTDFYQLCSESFSKTRKSGWPGWDRLMDCARDALAQGESRPLRILDAACGNLRFMHVLHDWYPDAPIECRAVDNCPDLLPKDVPEWLDLQFVHLDIIEALRADEDLPWLMAPGHNRDLSVSFGFMHHIPLQRQRTSFARALIESTRPEGITAFSFWRFADDPALADKAESSHNKGVAELRDKGIDLFDEDFQSNDYLLGWGATQGVYRYCHSFTSEEVTEIAEAVSPFAHVVDRYRSDGRTGDLNEYLILQRR